MFFLYFIFCHISHFVLFHILPKKKNSHFIILIILIIYILIILIIIIIFFIMFIYIILIISKILWKV